jgi:cellulose synthase/poly-beta-1,6-N-acetylglucosamine synthase-like glycosyltransferase
MGSDWLSSISAYFEIHKPALLIAPVVYQNEMGILQKMFSLDFISLVAAGAGGAGAGLPLMGNGANLAFTKKAWQKANSGKSETFVSGDDVFLIHRIERLFGSKAIHFLKSASAIVRTNPPTNLRVFLQQRIRWASKAKGYKSPWAIFVSLVVLAVNLLIALLFFAGIFESWFFVIYGLFIILKLLIDLPLLIEFTGFVNKRDLLLLAFPLALIYPIYVVVAALAALFFRFEWKGRGGLK